MVLAGLVTVQVALGVAFNRIGGTGFARQHVFEGEGRDTLALQILRRLDAFFAEDKVLVTAARYDDYSGVRVLVSGRCVDGQGRIVDAAPPPVGVLLGDIASGFEAWLTLGPKGNDRRAGRLRLRRGYR